jgi:Xaa-Pro aminopeptidase
MNAPLVRLRKEIIAKNLDAILISSLSNIIYLTEYSGFSRNEREAYLLITKNQQYILTDGRYTQDVIKLIPDFKLIEISPKLPATKILNELKKKYKIKKLGIEENDLKVNEHRALKKYFTQTQNFDAINILRSIKNNDEILKIEKACKLGDEVFSSILKRVKFGVSEKEIASEIEFFVKKQDGEVSFSPIVAFGKNSAVPHHVPNDLKLAQNSIVLLDFGVKLDNYCSDMTRTIFFGSANAEFKKMYNTVLKAQSCATAIDNAAREYIVSQGYKTIPHSLGHGIGIDVHELPHISPNSKDILKDGMVFSIEPGIYLPNFGGVRIEDLVVLEKAGLRLLTHSPKNLIEI